MKTFCKDLLIPLLLISSLILTACSAGIPEVAPTSQENQGELSEQNGETASAITDPYLVTTLADVKSAVIQITAQGTFVDPEFGEYSGSGLGSGFIIDPSGLAITNNHVVTGAALVNVWVGGDISQTYNAQILAVSECSDLALIDIEGDGFPYLEWYPDPITVGLEVYAAGFPLGDPEFTLTRGIISKENANGESTWSSVNQVLEHDATINPGNSGGPLVTETGQLVGVNYATFAAANQYFAIGRDVTLDIIGQFKQGDDVDSLGINGMAVISDDGTLSGVWVSSIESGSAADQAGVQPGDLITILEGLPLAEDGSMATYCDIIRTQGAENTMGMEVIRFQTNQVLEGQFNGRELAISGTYSGTGSTSGNDGSGEEEATPELSSENILEIFEDGYMALTDDSRSLYVEVPVSWNDINGARWSSDWDGQTFEAFDIAAAPNLENYYSYYDSPGLNFSASSDWPQIGSFSELLDHTTMDFEKECELVQQDDYQDLVYEGVYQYWVCGNADVVVISARPIEDPLAYLVLVTVQLTPDQDFSILDRIEKTFEYIP